LHPGEILVKVGHPCNYSDLHRDIGY
jgi:hypothetical protein